MSIYKMKFESILKSILFGCTFLMSCNNLDGSSKQMDDNLKPSIGKDSDSVTGFGNLDEYDKDFSDDELDEKAEKQLLDAPEYSTWQGNSDDEKGDVVTDLVTNGYRIEYKDGIFNSSNSNIIIQKKNLSWLFNTTAPKSAEEREREHKRKCKYEAICKDANIKNIERYIDKYYNAYLSIIQDLSKVETYFKEFLKEINEYKLNRIQILQKLSNMTSDNRYNKMVALARQQHSDKFDDITNELTEAYFDFLKQHENVDMRYGNLGWQLLFLYKIDEFNVNLE